MAKLNILFGILIVASLFLVSASETTIGTFTTNQEETNITDFITSSKKWFNIKFTPNKRMKIDANVSIQVFLESK